MMHYYQHYHLFLSVPLFVASLFIQVLKPNKTQGLPGNEVKK